MGAYAIDVGLNAMNARGNDPEPLAPMPPEAGECCGDGCARCVNDLFAEAENRYETALAAWRARQRDPVDKNNQPGLCSVAD